MVIKFAPSEWERILKVFQQNCNNKLFKKVDYENWKTLTRETRNKCVYIDTDAPMAKKANVWAILSVEYPAEKNSFNIGLDISRNSFGCFLYDNWSSFDYLEHKTKDDLPTAANDMISSTLDNNKISSLSSYIDDSCSISCPTNYDAVLTYNPESNWIATNKISTEYCAVTDTLEMRFSEKADLEELHAVQAQVDSINSEIDNLRSDLDATYCMKADKYLVDKANCSIERLEVEFQTLAERLQDVVQSLEDLNKTINNKDEKKEKNSMFKFDFGSCADNEKIAMSMYGLAIRNEAGVWVSYDANTKSVIDVDILNFRDMNRYIYKMPIAMKDIAVGDMVIHNKVPMFVNEITPEGKIVVIDIYAGEEKIIMPTKNMFGFNFVTKVVSLLDMNGMAKPSEDNPFGNLGMLMMLESGDIDPMMLMMMNGGKMDMSNPMMMYALMNKSSSSDIMPLIMMANMNK